MSNLFQYLNSFLFIVLPYAAVLLFVLVCIYRYCAHSFTYSSLSSQLLENRHHFQALVPFHYGLLIVLTAHLWAFLFPKSILLWNRIPLRLYILEVSGLILGILALVGLMGIIYRRLINARVRKVTSGIDMVLYILLLLQVISGIGVAITHPWGSSWFAASMAPYLWSLVRFSPDTSYVVALPLVVKLHVINAFVIIGFFPFTRLVHSLVVPVPYLWRSPQVVRWYREHRDIT